MITSAVLRTSCVPTTHVLRHGTMMMRHGMVPAIRHSPLLDSTGSRHVQSYVWHRAVTVSASSSSPVDMIREKNKENPVMVYSKSYCPFCMEVKSLMKQLDVPAKIVELDELADGDDIQDALVEISGMRTVPQVFIGGKLVGGCDDTVGAYKSGNLASMLKQVGIEPKE